MAGSFVMTAMIAWLELRKPILTAEDLVRKHRPGVGRIEGKQLQAIADQLLVGLET